MVRAASLIGLRVRPIGSTHSWSPLYPDDGQVALYTSHLTRHDGPRIELTQVRKSHLLPDGGAEGYRFGRWMEGAKL